MWYDVTLPLGFVYHLPAIICGHRERTADKTISNDTRETTSTEAASPRTKRPVLSAPCAAAFLQRAEQLEAQKKPQKNECPQTIQQILASSSYK